MDSLVINGLLIEEYVQEMYTIIDRIVDELETMINLKNDLVWDSQNKEKLLTIYDTKLKEYHLFANKCLSLISFIENYTSEYEQCSKNLKSRFERINESLNR